MRRRIWISGSHSNTPRAGVSARDRSRKITAQSPVASVAWVAGSGPSRSKVQRQAISAAGRQSNASVTRRNRAIFRCVVMPVSPSDGGDRPVRPAGFRRRGYAVLSLRLGPPLASKTVCFSDLRRRHFHRRVIAAFGGVGAGIRIGTSHGRYGEPLERLDVVACQAGAVGVQAGEPDLGKRVALLGSPAIPRCRWRIFLPAVVKAGETELAVRMAPLGGLAKPRHRRGLVAGDTIATKIQVPQPGLGI